MGQEAKVQSPAQGQSHLNLPTLAARAILSLWQGLTLGLLLTKL